MAENRMLRTNPLVSRVQRHAAMSTIFRAAAADSTMRPASGPLVRGFVWSPGAWTAVEQTAVEQTAVTPMAELPTAVSPKAASAAQPLQRQPAAVASAMSTAAGGEAAPVLPKAAADNSPMAVELAVPAPTMAAPPQLEPPLTSTVAANTETIAPSDSPIAPPVVSPETTVTTPVPPIQRQPAAPTMSKPASAEAVSTAPLTGTTATSSPVTPPPMKSSPSPLGRIWRRLGGLVARPQPVAAPSQLEPTAVSIPTTPISSLSSPTAVQLSEAADVPEPGTTQPLLTTSVTPTAEMPGEAQEEAPFSTLMPVGSTDVDVTAPAPSLQRQPNALASPTPPLVSSTPQTAPASLNLPMTAIPHQPDTPAGPSLPVLPTVPPTAVPSVPHQPVSMPPPPAASVGALATAVPLQPLSPVPPSVAAQTQPSVPPSAGQPSVVQRQPESAVPPSEEDRNWRRLAQIMHLHQEQAEIEGTVPSSDSGSTSSTAVPVPFVKSGEQAKAATPTHKQAPGVVSRQPSVLPREAPMVAVAGGRGPVMRETAVPTTPAANPAPGAPAPGAPMSLADGVADETMIATSQPKADEFEDETTVTATPLEVVWPVQSVQREPDARPPILPDLPPIELVMEPPVRPATPQDAWVQERLSAVPPGMPTDSSVPLLRPRRPRPVRAESGAAVTAVPDVSDRVQTAVSIDSAPVVPVLQRQPDPEPSGGLVSTEIGDLPPDLWALIGQPSPPVSHPERVSEEMGAEASTGAEVSAPVETSIGNKTVMAKRDGNGVTAVHSTPPLFSPPIPDASHSSQAVPDLSDYIQRAEEEGGADSDAGTTAAPLVEGGEEVEEEGEKKENEEVDINELARQVYAHIRGQLSVDRERERGRLMHNW